MQKLEHMLRETGLSQSLSAGNPRAGLGVPEVQAKADTNTPSWGKKCSHAAVPSARAALTVISQRYTTKRRAKEG